MSRYNYYGFPPPSRPRPAKGGIKAQSKRGAFGESWWARQWIEVLESFHIGARLSRGRSYARQGQVISINVGKGVVEARVQGSRSRPYDVVIEVKTLSKAQWRRLAGALGKETFFTAKLLAGEMPENIGDVFKTAGLSLFPEKSKDLKTDCSCPDWSNPCKHIAAVYYLLGEEFDRDPFLIFKLRGMSREELVELMGSESGAQGRRKQVVAPESEKESLPSPEPLAVDPLLFWGEGNIGQGFLDEVRIPPVAAALPRRLGKFPFWRGANFLESLERIYRSASPAGMDVLLGERGSDESR